MHHVKFFVKRITQFAVYFSTMLCCRDLSTAMTLYIHKGYVPLYLKDKPVSARLNKPQNNQKT